MGVPPEQVVPTEDGAVAIASPARAVALVVATRDQASGTGWAASVIRTDEGFSPGSNGVDVAACMTPRLIRSVFVFGQLGQSGVTGPLQLAGLPVAPSADVLGGDLVNGLYVFALRGPLAPGSLLTVTGPDAPTSHGAPGHPSFKGWAQVSVPGAAVPPGDLAVAGGIALSLVRFASLAERGDPGTFQRCMSGSSAARLPHS